MIANNGFSSYQISPRPSGKGSIGLEGTPSHSAGPDFFTATPEFGGFAGQAGSSPRLRAYCDRSFPKNKSPA